MGKGEVEPGVRANAYTHVRVCGGGGCSAIVGGRAARRCKRNGATATADLGRCASGDGNAVLGPRAENPNGVLCGPVDRSEF